MSNLLEHRRQAQIAFRKRNPTYYRDKMREKKERDPKAYALQVRKTAIMFSYGLTIEDYDRMFKAQKGRCALCGTTEPGQRKKHLCIDHDHKTGRARGLLCQRCNRGLGLLADSLKIITKAAKYLRGEFPWQRKK